MLNDQDLVDFIAWAERVFPGYTSNHDIWTRAQSDWVTEKRVRALEAEGISRSDAQAVIEAEDMWGI